MNFSKKSVVILGVNVSCILREDFFHLPLDWITERTKRTVMYVNAHCLNLALTDYTYRDILNSVDMVYADGISVVWAAKFLGGCQLEKNTGREWVYELCSLAEKKTLRIYILAGSPGVATNAQTRLSNQFPKLQIVGTHQGYLDDSDTSSLLDEINQSKPHILFVGMGTPLQEKWLAAHRDQIDAPVCWAVGALFDYIAGIENPVPPWLNKIHLEWFWRMLVDPAGKWRRYLIGNPMFLFRVIRQKVK